MPTVGSLPLRSGNAVPDFAALIENLAAPYRDWRIEPDNGTGSRQWIRLHHAHAIPRRNGWKLHVSAGLCSAVPVLEKVVPVLLWEKLSFKVAASMQMLTSLNRGEYGYSQIGKFITIYPTDDDQALRLATKLDEATSGLRGPAIPSDRRLKRRSLVHYRYGAFREQLTQTVSGETVLAVRQSGGLLVPDQRRENSALQLPFDPFVASAESENRDENAGIPQDRFLFLSTLQRSARGAVHLCLDFASGQQRVLKQAGRDCLLDLCGRDAHDRLRHESRVLSKLLPDSRFPDQYGFIEGHDQLFLILEHIAGETLAMHMERLAGQGSLPTPGQVIEWGIELARSLQKLHSRKIVYRDLKPANVLLTPQGTLRIVDFELAHVESSNEPAFGLGTRGYFSPQQAVGLHSCASDDVYSLGSLLYFLCTNAAPTLSPDLPRTRGRLTMLSPSLPRGLASVIEGCLENSPHDRYACMQEVIEQLLAATSDPRSTSVSTPFPNENNANLAGRQLDDRYATFARQLGHTICRAARPTCDGTGWVSTRRPGLELVSRDLGNGSAGVVLCLAQLVEKFGIPEFQSLLTEGAWSLASVNIERRSPLPGLYAGEAGVGAAVLRAGQVLGDQGLMDWALQCSRRISLEAITAPDLLSGAAGRLRFHLMAWTATQAPDHLGHALSAGDWLLKNGAGSDEHLYWLLPDDYGELGGTACLGYARGAAGIADALLDLFDASGEQRFLEGTQRCANWILSFARSALADGTGLCWPRHPGGTPRGAFWCHGAAGIGQFLVHFSKTGFLRDGVDIVSRVVETVCRGTRWAGPTQCHGLAGNIEFLIDFYQVTGSPEHLAAAHSLASILETFSRDEDGVLLWQSDLPEIITPDYLFGYAGVALSLLRLSSPCHIPHELSLMNFRNKSSVTEAYCHEAIHS